MRQSNIFTVKRFEVEHNPCEPQGKQYSNAVGFGMSTSLKKAKEQARKMYSATSNGGTPILGEMAIFKGGKLISGSWDENDQRMFSDFKKKYEDEKELEALILEEAEASL